MIELQLILASIAISGFIYASDVLTLSSASTLTEEEFDTIRESIHNAHDAYTNQALLSQLKATVNSDPSVAFKRKMGKFFAQKCSAYWISDVEEKYAYKAAPILIKLLESSLDNTETSGHVLDSLISIVNLSGRIRDKLACRRNYKLLMELGNCNPDLLDRISLLVLRIVSSKKDFFRPRYFIPLLKQLISSQDKDSKGLLDALKALESLIHQPGMRGFKDRELTVYLLPLLGSANHDIREKAHEIIKLLSGRLPGGVYLFMGGRVMPKLRDIVVNEQSTFGARNDALSRISMYIRHIGEDAKYIVNEEFVQKLEQLSRDPAESRLVEDLVRQLYRCIPELHQYQVDLLEKSSLQEKKNKNKRRSRANDEQSKR